MKQQVQGIPPELEETIQNVRIVAGHLFGYDGSGPIRDWFDKLSDEQRTRAFQVQHEASKDRFAPERVPDDQRIDEVLRRFSNDLEKLIRKTHGQVSPAELQVLKPLMLAKLNYLTKAVD